MTGAFLYLRLTSLRNLLWARLVRLRQPKYLVGGLVGIAYFYFILFRQTKFGNGGLAALSHGTAETVTALGSLALLAVAIFMWMLPSGRPGLTFTEAEIAFLFPAPVSRRSLVHYKLISTQVTTLLQSLFFTVIFNHRSFADGRAVQIIVGWWLLLSAVNLHHVGASLTIARLAESGVGVVRRRILIGIAIAAVAGVAGGWVWREIPPAPGDLDQLSAWVASVAQSGPLAWLLWPARALLRPFFASGPGAFAVAAAPALVVLLAHYFWVARMNVAFEEASVLQAEKRAHRLAEMRQTGTMRLGAERRSARREPFPLAGARWTELAFLWKNLLSTSRPWFTGRNWLIAAGLLIATAAILMQTMGSQYWMAGGTLAGVSSMVGAGALFYGPLLSRLDLRQDLANADILKTYPLPGWRVVLGELLAPIAIITGAIWLALLGWWLGLHGHQPPALSVVWFSDGMRIVLVLCAAVVAPLIVALELLVPNAAPIYLPGWFHAVRTPGAGIDLMGQRLIFGFGQIFVVLLALLPAAGGAALVGFIVQAFLGPAISAAAATLVMLLVLAGELWCGLWIVGRRFERFDLSSENRS